MSSQELDAKAMGRFSLICSIIVASCFAIHFGLTSAMVSREGTLIGASLICTHNGGDCLYKFHKRFEYSNKTHHCTVTSLESFIDRVFAENALSKVELGTTQTIWLSPMSTHTCFTEDIIQEDFKNAYALLVFSLFLFAIGSCCCCADNLCPSEQTAGSRSMIRHVRLRTDEEDGAEEIGENGDGCCCGGCFKCKCMCRSRQGFPETAAATTGHVPLRTVQGTRNSGWGNGNKGKGGVEMSVM